MNHTRKQLALRLIVLSGLTLMMTLLTLPADATDPAAVDLLKGAEVSADPAPAKKACDQLFPSRLQADVRAACSAGAKSFVRSARKSAQIQCRLSYGASARENNACLIGEVIAEDVAAGKSEFDAKRVACAAHYPAHTEVDLYLQESCLAGNFFPRTLGRSTPNLCREVTPERSFIGPCEVGLSLALHPNAPSEVTATGGPAPDQHNELCDRYFDHRQLHQGYRACLNARGIGAESSNLAEVLGSCEQILSDDKSDIEKAACMVGSSASRALAAGRGMNDRFKKCGVEKVSYRDKDILACLTAASFLDFGDKREASRGCSTVFSARRSTTRGECERAVMQF